MLKEATLPFGTTDFDEVSRWVSSIALLGPDSVKVESIALRDALVARFSNGPSGEQRFVAARDAYLDAVRKALRVRSSPTIISTFLSRWRTPAR